MPTDDERREVAAMLTRISSGAWRESIRGLLVKVARALDVPTEGTCVNMLSDIFERLADFVESDDRTCANTCEAIGRTGLPMDGPFICSECGCHSETWYTTPHGDKWTEAPGFCPNCGARVVEG